jgi:hypothetical protein
LNNNGEEQALAITGGKQPGALASRSRITIGPFHFQRGPTAKLPEKTSPVELAR